jgi:hypothetical protein
MPNQHSIGPSTSAAGLTMNAAQMGAVLRQVSQTSPVASEAIESACRKNGGDIARVRNGLLYSTSALTVAAGAIAAGSSCTLFNVGIGQADPVLLALTKAETNMITGGSLKNRAFQAVKLGFRVYYDTNVAASNADDVLETLSWVLNNTSVDFRLGAQDVQTLGNLAQWPMTSNTPNGGPGDGAAVSLAPQAGYLQNGYEIVCPYDLSIPAETSISMTCTLQAPFAAVGAAVNGNIAIQACFYGYDITAIQG